MSYRTIAGAAAGGVSYHYDNADAASSGIRYRTIAGTASTSGSSLLPVNNANWRGAR
jgi:hypothetical protein